MLCLGEMRKVDIFGQINTFWYSLFHKPYQKPVLGKGFLKWVILEKYFPFGILWGLSWSGWIPRGRCRTCTCPGSPGRSCGWCWCPRRTPARGRCSSGTGPGPEGWNPGRSWFHQRRLNKNKVRYYCLFPRIPLVINTRRFFPGWAP